MLNSSPSKMFVELTEAKTLESLEQLCEKYGEKVRQLLSEKMLRGKKEPEPEESLSSQKCKDFLDLIVMDSRKEDSYTKSQFTRKGLWEALFVNKHINDHLKTLSFEHCRSLFRRAIRMEAILTCHALIDGCGVVKECDTNQLMQLLEFALIQLRPRSRITGRIVEARYQDISSYLSDLSPNTFCTKFRNLYVALTEENARLLINNIVSWNNLESFKIKYPFSKIMIEKRLALLERDTEQNAGVTAAPDNKRKLPVTDTASSSTSGMIGVFRLKRIRAAEPAAATVTPATNPGLLVQGAQRNGGSLAAVIDPDVSDPGEDDVSVLMRFRLGRQVAPGS